MADQTAQKPRRSRWYAVAKAVVIAALHTIVPVRFVGAERLEQVEPPYILIGNHQSWMDPIPMAVAVKKHQVRFLAKKELAACKPLESIFREAGVILVDRHNSDMEAMRACIACLRQGSILGVFPEGTRHHEGLMEELESGVAMIALRSRVPLLPVYIAGKLKLFRTLHVYVGKPIMMDDLRAEGINTQTCQALLGRITETYAALDAARPKA